MRSIDGSADAAGAVYAGVPAGHPAVVEDSLISGNTVKAVAAGGPALARGAGLVNDGKLRLTRVTVSSNSGSAGGAVRRRPGRRIWNGAVFSTLPIKLTLEDTAVTHNALTAAPGLTVEGGGLFTAFPVTLVDADISRNTPDQCSGC